MNEYDYGTKSMDKGNKIPSAAINFRCSSVNSSGNSFLTLQEGGLHGSHALWPYEPSTRMERT